MKRQWRILSCYCYACYCKVGFHLPQSADAAAISKCIWLWQVKDNNEGWSDLIIIICLEVILIKASSNVCSQYHLYLLLWLSIQHEFYPPYCWSEQFCRPGNYFSPFQICSLILSKEITIWNLPILQIMWCIWAVCGPCVDPQCHKWTLTTYSDTTNIVCQEIW